jgi:PTS system cellobiose-specific IIC component
LYIVFCIAYQYAQKKGLKKQSTTIGLVALMCFMVITPYTAAADAYSAATLTTEWLGSSGMFMAIITGFLVGWIFKLCKEHHVEITLPKQVPPTIARQFSALIPGFIAIVLFMAVNGVFGLTSFGDAQTALYSLVRVPLSAVSSSLFGEFILVVFLYLLWFFGIHGGLAVMPIMMLLFTNLQLENLAAYQAGTALPNWITGTYLSVGSGSICMLVAMLIWGKSKANRSISKLAVVPAFFGVDEPAYFGMPMIMNPIFFIPWVIITPALCVFGTYILQAIGLLPYATGASAGSFVPFFVGDLVSYGWKGVVWGCIFFAVDILIYLPFVKVYDNQMLAKEAAQEEKIEESEAEPETETKQVQTEQ